MIINYTSKIEREIDLPNIKATIVTYEVSKKDLEFLSKFPPQSQYLFMNCDKRPTEYDIIVDSLDTQRFMTAGITTNHKAVLEYYLVKKGLDKILEQLDRFNF